MRSRGRLRQSHGRQPDEIPFIDTARSAAAGVEPQEARVGDWRAAIAAEQPRRLLRGRGLRRRGGLRRAPPMACRLLRLLRSGLRLRGGQPLRAAGGRARRRRRASTAAGTRYRCGPDRPTAPSASCPGCCARCSSAPRLIASRAAAMSPRLIASNSASVGSRSLAGRTEGATRLAVRRGSWQGRRRRHLGRWSAPASLPPIGVEHLCACASDGAAASRTAAMQGARDDDSHRGSLAQIGLSHQKPAVR